MGVRLTKMTYWWCRCVFFRLSFRHSFLFPNQKNYIPHPNKQHSSFSHSSRVTHDHLHLHSSCSRRRTSISATCSCSHALTTYLLCLRYLRRCFFSSFTQFLFSSPEIFFPAKIYHACRRRCCRRWWNEVSYRTNWWVRFWSNRLLRWTYLHLRLRFSPLRLIYSYFL